jgi:predicted phosphodiesterase
MWRRDSSGVFLENRDTMNKIMNLKQRINVYYVAGNHDFHVLRLQNFSYRLDFEPNLTLHDGEYTYCFVHGYQFDPLQQEPLMEGLCHVMSDATGNFESEIWGAITASWTDIDFVVKWILRRKTGIRETVENLQKPPEERLKDTLGQVEKNACERAKILQPKGILVFGHTHRPFVCASETVVNTGSWVTDANPHNTYVTLSNGKPRLFIFRGNEITDRSSC